eukprot:scaffold682_cov363-Pavlova_lutheri.AAC.27
MEYVILALPGPDYPPKGSHAVLDLCMKPRKATCARGAARKASCSWGQLRSGVPSSPEGRARAPSPSSTTVTVKWLSTPQPSKRMWEVERRTPGSSRRRARVSGKAWREIEIGSGTGTAVGSVKER